jgi:hypothetical protein
MKKHQMMTIAAVMLLSSFAFAQQIPSFRVTGQVRPSAISILVPDGTSQEQITRLVQKLRQARVEQRLASMIPSTTPGGAAGDHGIVMLFIFSDSRWGTSEKLNRFINSNGSLPNRKFSSEFVEHIKGYYYFTALSGGEEGSIGYDDHGGMRSKVYKKIF